MARSPKRATRERRLTPALLRGWPLPRPDEDGDKEERGRVLVVGGSREMPGAVILAATAALRAGAGKLQIATARSIAQLVASEVPEARVFALAETRSGGIDPRAAKKIGERAEQARAVLVGPGMIDEAGVARLMKGLVGYITRAVLVVDAAALFFLASDPEALCKLEGRAILTPHADEMKRLCDRSRSAIKAAPAETAPAETAPAETARRAAEIFRAVVALKGRETYIARPNGELYCNRTGNVGLATSGSGDVLAGIMAGIAARGASPVQAAAWSVYLHGRAGDRLARRIGKLGFLARELLDEIPPIMNSFDRPQRTD